MELEKNLLTRRLYKRLLKLSDKVGGVAFPKMKRVKQITSSHCGPAVVEMLLENGKGENFPENLRYNRKLNLMIHT